MSKEGGIVKTDVLIIGGGPAGMAAALGCAENGTRCIIVERNAFLGGILRQCIHNGFGLHYFGEEFTGPEYAHKFIEKIENNKKIQILLNTFVTRVEGKTVFITNENGMQKITARAIVLAMGCRERTPANILLTGTRPAGVLTAGCAQKLVNIHGKMPGKNIVILGSGDIGLIMARRLTLQGAKVHAVMEINPFPSGLRRNITQCLEDFDIPLLLKTTIFEVVGKDRIEGVYYGQVDEKYRKIHSTKEFLPCDCLILSVGLTPERDLVEYLPYNKATKSTFVDDLLETNERGVFACGNFLHVHDLVDNVSREAYEAGKNASDFAKREKSLFDDGATKTRKYNVECGNLISYVLPNYVRKGKESCALKFRLKNKIVRRNLVVKQGDKEIARKFVLAGSPGEMGIFEIDKSKITGDITLEVEEI